MGTDVTLLDTWYKKDANAVPPVSILQPISSILINFLNRRVPKLQAEDQAVWWDTMTKMQKLFRKGSLSLFNQNKMTKEEMHNYYMSGGCKVISTFFKVIKAIIQLK